MVGGTGHALGRTRGGGGLEAQARPVAAPIPSPAAVPASAETERIDALAKLKGLFDTGVLTPEQYESERRRLTAGI
jgi:hypothetical protein